MEFTAMMHYIKSVVSIGQKGIGLMSRVTTKSVSTVPMYIAALQFIIRLSLLALIMFIFLLWPAGGNYDPTGFDAWSQRMTDLPIEVWGIISTILLFWGTGELMAATSNRKRLEPPPTPDLPTDGSFLEDGEDFMSMTPDEVDGRFKNLSDDDEEFFSEAMPPNSVIEAWNKNEAE